MDQKQQFSATNEVSTSNNSTISKSKNQIGSGNYINVVPMAIVSSAGQYHSRRKYPSSQVANDYQSRVYFGDYIRDRCRDDTSQNSYYSLPQQMHQQQQQQHQQSVATSTNDMEIITPPPSSSNTSVASNQQQTITPSMLYRVIPTTYGTNSSTIASRNDTDAILNNSGPNSSTNKNNYQLSNQDTSQQQQQQQQQQHQVNQQSSNVSNNATNNYYGMTTALTSSSGFNNQSRPMQKVIPTVVYLMSRIAVHMEIEGTSQCPSQVMLAAAIGCEELGISNKLLAQNVFGLWMSSSLLEIQLKPHHRPYAIRSGAWSNLLEKHTHGNEIEKYSDEPMITLRRNVFYSKKDEEKIKDPRIIELLYEESRHNVLMGRYIMEAAHYIMLGGIQARIELGPYNIHTHTVSYFRENQFRFLPAHIARSNFSWLPYSRRQSSEVKLLEQFKRIPTTATTRKLMRKYLEFCWTLPFYGAAFFQAQVEEPIRGLMSFFQQKDIPVLIGLSEKGIYIIDQVECTLLLGLKYEEFSWDMGKPPSSNDDPECMPCLFIQFGAIENGIAVTKLMQIFSRQAAMMDALISHFAEQMRRRKDESDPIADNINDDEANPIQNNGIGVLSNKFSRLTLATFDDEGRCIGQMGSLTISY